MIKEGKFTFGGVARDAVQDSKDGGLEKNKKGKKSKRDKGKNKKSEEDKLKDIVVHGSDLTPLSLFGGQVLPNSPVRKYMRYHP